MDRGIRKGEAEGRRQGAVGRVGRSLLTSVPSYLPRSDRSERQGRERRDRGEWRVTAVRSLYLRLTLSLHSLLTSLSTA